MSDKGWLMRSLEQASKQATELPSWATEITTAVAKFYEQQGAGQQPVYRPEEGRREIQPGSQ